MIKLTPLFIILLAVYAIPITRLALFFIPRFDLEPVRKIDAILGRIEWFIHPLRDYLLFAALICSAGYFIYTGEIVNALLLVPFALVSVFAKVRILLFRRRMADFGVRHPDIHPKLFFECYYAGFGPFPIAIPKDPKELIKPFDCSFKVGKTSKCFWPVLAGVFNTATIARLITASFRWKGPEYARKAAGTLSTIWGTRAAQLGRMSIKTEGLDKLNGLEGKNVFVFNHKSFLDFAFGTLALYGHGYDFRFLAARDHFLDNPFLRFIMGRAMEVVGTIFVDRNEKSSYPRAAAIEASEKLFNLDIDIVMFPQGTRAYANVDAKGKRLDSGYYTSGNKRRLCESGGHMKKGAAHIAVDTAVLLKKVERSQVNIVPVALIGTGMAVPRKSIVIQKDTDIVIKIGQPIIIKGSAVSKLEHDTHEHKEFVDDINLRIDNALKGLLDVHSLLEKRYFRDIRSLMPATDYEHAAVAMKAWRGRDYLIYTLLDCIYAAHPKNWPTFLREVSNLMMSDAPFGSFMHFKERVVDFMIEGTTLK
ncbi:MAG: hypothetical protein COV46_06915 [Deltaproteobacteria bacterium CG11_big_fil_rev_8_21_14_0_20_49_13]|nr:MAG: hypothetical protein COV46_06915 [Deltaproteobacteria bacterium CG11_big_fil_rev_8_21_14_0_20_49_13]